MFPTVRLKVTRFHVLRDDSSKLAYWETVEVGRKAASLDDLLKEIFWVFKLLYIIIQRLSVPLYEYAIVGPNSKEKETETKRKALSMLTVLVLWTRPCFLAFLRQERL